MRNKEKHPSSYEEEIAAIEEINRTLVAQIVEEFPPPYPPPGSLASAELLKHRQKEELEQLFNFHPTLKRLDRAFDILKNHHIVFMEPTEDASRKAMAKQIAQELKEAGLEGNHPNHTFSDILCIPHEKMDAAYSVGKELFEKKHFVEACDIFFLLTQLNPYYANVWIAMGLCWQNQQVYDEALGNFTIAILLNDKNPEPYLSSIECFLALKDPEQAQTMLKLVTPIIEQHRENTALKERLATLKHQITTSGGFYDRTV